MDLTDNALRVLQARYFLRDKNGQVSEDAQGMFRRVARAIAQVETLYDPKADVQALEDAFYGMMARLEFLPNSPTLMNAGTGAGTLSACFVIGLEDTMEGIMDTAKHAAMVQKFGGGTGFALSKIRPKGAPISTTHGKACGPVAVLRHLSSVSKLVTQGGKRDGANMAVMDVRHPDIMEFITCKRKEGEIHNFNISVGVDTEFMEKVERGEDYDLIDPRTGQVVGRLNARKVFKEIVYGAWLNGEPGMLFMDRINQDNATPHLGKIMATNPCGEQPLLPYESCNLGSINLAKFLRYTPDAVEIDWERLRQTIRLAVRFLDNVIDANKYAIPEIERMTKLTRKIGLGIMGWADALFRLGIPYDSEEALALARQVISFFRREADAMSAELAQQRGPFPAFKGSIHDKPGAPPLRNAWRLSIAPTGTISMIAGCSSGIEPVFALVFRKHNILGGQTLYYIDQTFEAVARAEGFYSDALMEHLAMGKSLQERTEVPAWVRRLFVTAPDISPEWHVRMQAAFQEFVDSGISKTINFPNSATQEDVWRAYILAWKLGCKGITVYRAGSREQEVLTAGTTSKPQEAAAAPPSGTPQPYLRPRERPVVMTGRTERIRTGHGNMYVTINSDEQGRPFEVFVALGKAGGCDSAQLEAIARLVSLALRSGVDPQAIVEQLRGITCCPAWDGGVQVKSAPDALALALGRAIGKEPPRPEAIQPSLLPRNGDHQRPTGNWGVCKKCNGPLVYQEGCLTCRACGYSECG
ncbi:MAG: vitamin B12-dependent ribonucleotide reductase [Dehalococcoidia bacterium]|nr:vitamin B12-dependent ribonucleotide reductase [Dehalococcoidia bacterium]MDW8119315.1 vitamin B12-dependent ribonucleotide reductase [Chloroflexota bacterium]